MPVENNQIGNSHSHRLKKRANPTLKQKNHLGMTGKMSEHPEITPKKEKRKQNQLKHHAGLTVKQRRFVEE